MKLILLLSLAFITLVTAEKSQPNILVILTDDHRWDYLGIAGHPILKPPNIDQLAREGTYFPNAFVTSASWFPKHAQRRSLPGYLPDVT